MSRGKKSRSSVSGWGVGLLGMGMSIAVSAQDAPAPAGDEMDEIVVRGVRGSVESAQEIKRSALQVTDSIVAEDIGKLPDNNVAEALSRVTGVQINRIRAGASATLVRGLPNVVTTLNGREIFTTTGRGIALQDIPADLLQRVEVRKSNSPEHLSGGIAGGIDVALRRPFDFDDSAAAFAVRGIYSDQAETTSPVGSALISNRWDLGDGSFGALLGVSYQVRDYLEQNTFNGTYDQVQNPSNPGGPPILRPFVIGAISTLGDHARTSVNGSLQWQPNDSAEITFDAFMVKYDEDFELNFWIPLPGIPGTAVAATLKPDSNVAQTWQSQNVFTLTSNQAFKRESNTRQLALSGKFDLNDRIELRSALAYTKSFAHNRGVILDTGFIAPRMDVNFSIGGASSAVITNADGSPFDVTDSSHYWMEQLFDQRDDQEGNEYALTSDLSFAMDGFFSSFDAGLQLSRRSARSNAANGGGVHRNRFAPVGFDNLIFVDDVEARTGVAGIQDVSPRGMLDGERDIATDQWFIANREFLLDHTDAIRELFFLSPSPPPNDPARFFDDEEDTSALYAQFKFDTELGSVGFDGVFGARYVRTESTLEGVQQTNTGGGPVFTPLALDKSDSDVLPSFNGRLKFSDELHLRLALFKTITRPNFADLNPQTTLTAPGPTLPGQGAGGNPFLENVEAKSADLSFEWYFSKGSLLSTTLFYRDIEGYIQIFSSPETYNGQVFQVSRPQSSGSGDMKGLEFAYTHFFDKLPGIWSDFGVQLNYTRIDASADTIAGEDQDLTNVSDSSYNAILMYENDKLSSRLAYNWRSDYVESYNQSGAQPGAVRVKPISTLDFSLGYNFSDKITLAFDATNLLDRPLFNYFGGGSASSRDAFLYNRDVRSNDRTFSLGVRMRL
jgi:iron complex outermembrane recepter protein